MNDDDTGFTPSSTFINTINKQYTIYLGDIGSPEQYTECFEQIRHAGPDDMIKFHINSSGGNGFTAVQFLRAMAETKAVTIASVEGQCASAATMIFLSAKVQEITPHSIFVFHNYSGSASGKGSEMYDQISHMQKWSSELIKDIYKHFLNEEEIGIVLGGKDLYMTSEDVGSRLNRRNEILKSKNNTPKKTRKPRKEKEKEKKDDAIQI